MPEIVHFSEKLNSVYVDSFGKVGPKDVEQSINEVAELLKKHDSNQLIVNVKKQKVALELVDTFDLCKVLMPVLPANLKIAYITNDPPLQSQAFFKLISDSLGHPVEVFYCLEDAADWFEGKLDPDESSFIGKVKFPGSTSRL